MASDFDSAHREAEASGGSSLTGFVNTLAHRVGGFASAGAVYGEPVEQDGVTVVPVARVRWGFGGGGGTDSVDDGADTEGGAGGAGMVSAHPTGFIELRDGEATFRPIKDPIAPVLLVLSAGVSAWLVLRGLKSLFR